MLVLWHMKKLLRRNVTDVPFSSFTLQYIVNWVHSDSIVRSLVGSKANDKIHLLFLSEILSQSKIYAPYNINLTLKNIPLKYKYLLKYWKGAAQHSHKPYFGHFYVTISLFLDKIHSIYINVCFIFGNFWNIQLI